jgi:maltose O-acetyltransferase
LDDPSKRIFTNGVIKPIIIGNNCWIGTSAIILPGTTLGNNCIVAAGSIVNGEFKDNSLIGGNPAKFIRLVK